MNKESNYEEGKYYEGLGKYLGIITVHPYDKDYVLKKHKFVEKINDNTRKAAKVNEILIEKIKKSDR